MLENKHIFRSNRQEPGYPDQDPDDGPYFVMDLPRDPKVRYATKEELVASPGPSKDKDWYHEIRYSVREKSFSQGPVPAFWQNIFENGFYLSCVVGIAPVIKGITVGQTYYLKLEERLYDPEGELWELQARHFDTEYEKPENTVSTWLTQTCRPNQDHQPIVWVFPIDKIEVHTIETFLQRKDYFLERQRESYDYYSYYWQEWGKSQSK